MTHPTIRGANAEAFNSRELEIFVVGPSGSGKTFSILNKLQGLALAFPSVKIAIVRKTRKSMNTSALDTFEEEVYPEKLLNAHQLERGQRQYYSYPNGSKIYLFGMDAPDSDKVLGSRWDFIFVNECSEISEDLWEKLRLRLQAKNAPFNQIIGDSNGPPEGEQSWMWKRIEHGVTPVYYPDHSLNPTVSKTDLFILSSARGDLRRRMYLSGPDIFKALPVGKTFKPEYFKVLKARPAEAEWRRGWDIASGARKPNTSVDNKTSSRTAGVLMGLPYADKQNETFDGRIVIAHAIADWWEPGERNRRMREIAKGDVSLNASQFFGRGWGQGVDMTVSILNALKGLEVGVWALKEKGSKASRADSWAAQGEAGNLYVVDDGTWDVQGFITECCNFTGAEDELNDYVDAGSNANTSLMRDYGDKLADIWLTEADLAQAA